MIDPFVILAPVLLLAVIALLRFVGCNQVYGLEPTEPYPTPTLTGIDPNSGNVCGPAFTLKVSGTGFSDGVSTVQWNGSNRTTTFVSATQLEADISEDDIGAIGQVQVTVANGSLTSSPLPFDVVAGMPNDVFFDPQPPQVAASGDFLNGIYKNLDFGTGQWRWSGQPAGAVISFPTPGAASFSFANNAKRLLDNIIVYPLAAGTIKLSDGINPDRFLTFIALQINSFQTVATDWDKCSNTIKVEFDIAPSLPVFRITYFGPL